MSGAGGFISHTNDAGKTFQPVTSPFTGSLWAIRFSTPSFGVVAGDGGALFLTTDGGAHWAAPVLANATTHDLHAAAIAGDAHLVLVAGDDGAFLRSDDDGAHFASIAISDAGDFRGVATDDGAHFVALVDTRGNIFTSTDGAKTFVLSMKGSAALDAVVISDDGTRALATGAHGTAYYAHVGGAFGALATGTTVDLHAALVTADDARLYLAGENGTVLTSTDEGAHFASVAVSTSAAIYSLDDL